MRRLIYSLAVTFLLFELTLQIYYRATVGRFLFDRVAIPVFVSDPIRGYGVKPNLSYEHRTHEFSAHYVTNVQGFRTDETTHDVQVPKPQGLFRILLLGPSFAFGWGNNWEDTFAGMLQQRLAIAGKTVEVVNLGTPAQAMAHQLCWFEAYARSLDVDLVLQTVYGLPDDVESPCRTPDARFVKDGYLVRPGVGLVERSVVLAKNSAVVFYGWLAYQVFSLSISSQGLGTELYTTSAPAIMDQLDPPHVTIQFRAYERLVSRTLGREIPVVFLYIPFAYVVRPADRGRWRGYGRDRAEPLDVRQKAATMSRILNDSSVHFVDTTAALVQADALERMYFFVDIHLTPAGNRVVFQELMAKLESILSFIQRPPSPDSK